ncbi:MAG TPA: hypothetical protein PLE74_00455 [Candidatus Cloacimonadota bacterium]|nr:hypothetical protein [Candidatus Cloacimonadota bacterium]HPT70731.1 hypothetical protein [Candidatus Cloacimonadota bacterium]
MFIFLIFCGTFISLFSYPTYDLRENFNSLAFDKSQEIPYTLQKSKKFYEDVGFAGGEMPLGHYLYWNPKKKLLSLYDSDNSSHIVWRYSEPKLLWKTNRLQSLELNDWKRMIEKNGDAPVLSPFNKAGSLLKDRFSRQWVLKNRSGREIVLPTSLKDLHWYPTCSYLGNENDLLFAGIVNNKITYAFVNDEGRLMEDGPISITASADTIMHVLIMPDEKDVLVQYSNKLGSMGLLLVSKTGKTLWHMTDLPKFERIDVDRKYLNFAMLSNSANSSKMIVDLRNGQIQAEVLCKCMAIAEAQDTLLAIVANDKSAGVIDVTRGKLIQDFSKDLYPITDVELVKIAIEGYQIMIKGFKI